MKTFCAYFFLLLLMAPLLGVFSIGVIHQKHTQSTLEYNRVQKIELGVIQNVLQLSPEVVTHLIGVSKNKFIVDENANFDYDASLFQKWKNVHQKTSFLLDKLTDNQTSEFAFMVFLNSLFYSSHQIHIFNNEIKAILNGFNRELIFSDFLEILTPPPRL